MGRSVERLEMKEEHREKLLELAARRGGERLSDLVAEAIEHYLTEDGKLRPEPSAEIKPYSALGVVSEEARRAALAIRGSLTEAEAEELATETAALRRSWRSSH
jgi:hypothetical protein